MPNVFDQFDQAQTANPFDQFDAKPPPQTTGMAGAVRGLGVGSRAMIQGALSPFTLLADIPTMAYNAGANVIQGKDKGFRFPEQNQAVSDLLTKAGIPLPATPGERIASAIDQGGAGAMTGLGIGGAMSSASNPVVQGIGRTLTASPVKAAISGGTSGLASGLTREAGGGPIAQTAAGFAGGLVPYAGDIARPLIANASRTPAEVRAQAAGYTLPPATMDKPSILSKLLGGWSGKIKSQQGASAQNQTLTKQIAAGSLGLPRDTVLDDNVFSNIRKTAGTAYENVKQSVPTISTDPQFAHQVSGLGSLNSDVATHFPELVCNDDITQLATALAGKKDFPTAAGVEIVKILRSNGTKNLQAIGDPQKNALGFAQRDAANALDDLMDRNISAAGSPGLITQYRAARQLIARSHDVESATNTATGEIDPRRLALLSDKGKPIGGGLQTIADTAKAFPKAMQMPSKFGGAEPISILDVMAAGGSLGTGAATGHLGSGAALAGLTLSRPLIRQATLSPWYQAMIANQGAPLGFGTFAGMVPGQIGNNSIIMGQQ